MFCKECGNKIPDDTKYCQNCGHKQGSRDSNNMVIEQELPDYRKQELPIKEQQDTPNNNSNQIKQRVDTKKQSSNNSLKVVFFSLLGLVGVLFVVLIVVLASGGSNNAKSDDEIVKEILEQEPKVNMQEISDWDKGVYSINNIGSSSKANLSDYIGVWQALGTKVGAHDDKYLKQYDSSSGQVYIAIDDNNTVHSITKLPDSIISSHETVQYSIGEDGFVSDAPKGATPDSIMKYEIVDGDLVITNYLDDMQLTDCYIYKKTDLSADSIINSEHIRETETITPEPTEVVAQQQVYEIESQILGRWESTYENEYYGCEFYDNGTFRYIEQNGNQKPEESMISYQITSENTMILNGDDKKVFTITIDYEFGEYYLIIDNGETFTELSKVDELHPYPVDNDEPNDSHTNDELVYNIEEYLADTHWISTGVEFDNPDAVEMASGYPRTYDFEYGDLQYSFREGNIYLSNDQNETNESVYMGDPEGYYIYAFYREQNIDGKQRRLRSMFFVQGEYLYEVEMMDDVEVSNYIQFELYEP